ncbi:hypothetical protein [Rhodococcus sp. 24CO]|uniref:hypothetical protein n=1 Tax=Rhodococcus sp. 24CO TaxID=3117460 RepID=UPI003D33271E
MFIRNAGGKRSEHSSFKRSVPMRLRRSTPDGPGLAKMRRGKGFSYCDAQGSPVDDATQSRIRSLVVPPAWRSVWICPYSNGHIQAVGIDAAGQAAVHLPPAMADSARRRKV